LRLEAIAQGLEERRPIGKARHRKSSVGQVCGQDLPIVVVVIYQYYVGHVPLTAG
jgi:hypothetical protein